MTTFPAPPGYTAWLEKNPDLAFPGAETWLSLDLKVLSRVNHEVNASMTYRREPADVWGNGSDCEDYAIAKMIALLEAGVPRGAMRLAACRPGGGEGHAVLVVAGEWILTNGRDDVFSRHASALIIEAWETTDGQWQRLGTSLADLLPGASPFG